MYMTIGIKFNQNGSVASAKKTVPIRSVDEIIEEVSLMLQLPTDFNQKIRVSIEPAFKLKAEKE